MQKYDAVTAEAYRAFLTEVVPAREVEDIQLQGHKGEEEVIQTPEGTSVVGVEFVLLMITVVIVLIVLFGKLKKRGSSVTKVISPK